MSISGFAFSQSSGEVQVQSDMSVTGKMRIKPSGDIAMGVFQPTSSTGGTTGGGTGGGGTTLTPPPATGMFAWYHAEEAYKDLQITTKCVVNGTDTVAVLKDLSGNGRNLLQADTTKQPLWKNQQLNNCPAIEFDGTNDFLSLDSTSISTLSVYVVFKQISHTDGEDLLAIGGSTNPLELEQTNVATSIRAYQGSGGIITPIPTAVGKYHLVQCVSNGATSFAQLDGQTALTGNLNTSAQSKIYLGSWITGTENANIAVCEVIIYNSAQTSDTGDGLNVRKYLDAKYGLGLYTAPTAPPTANQFAWYAGDEAYKDSALTQKCTVTNTDDVVALKDLSNNNRHMLDFGASGNVKAKWVSSQINGHAMVKLTTSYLANNAPVGASYTIYVIAKVPTPGSGARLWLNSNSSLASGSPRGIIESTGTQYFYSMTTSGSAVAYPRPSNFDQTQYQIHIFSASPSGGFFAINSSKTDHAGNESITSGINIRSESGEYDFVEMLVYNTAQQFASGDGLTVRKYLDNKYNLGLGLNGAQLPAQNLYASYKSEEAYKDTGLTQLCSVSGTDTVAALKDLSNNGRHLIQATTDLMPKWFSNQKASKPAIRFDGLNDYLKGIFNINQPMTVVSLVKQNTRVDARYLMDGATVNSGRISQTSNNFTLSQYAGSNTTLDNPNASVGNYMLLYSTFDGANSKFLIDNSTAITGNCGTGSMGGLTLGANGNGANNSNIDLVETTVYNVALDPATGDGLKVRQYYSDKYALSLFGATSVPEPTAPAGMFAQYTADNAYKDVAFTQKCSSLNDVILALKDISGNNRNMVIRDTASTNTKWIPNAKNGKPVWRGAPPISEFRTTTSLSGPYVIYIVSNSNGVGTYWGNDANPNAGQPRTQADASQYFAPVNIAWMPAPAGFAQNKWLMGVWQMSGSGYMKVDNSPVTAHSYSYTLNGYYTSILGDVAEILIYNAQHDPDSGIGLDVRKYLNTKYNLGLTLP